MATSSGLKMALKHYKAYQKNPLPTASIELVNAQTYHVTTRLTTNGYQYDLHWILTIPDTYPFLPPLGSVAPGFYFSHTHIFDTGICNNFLGNHQYMHSSANDGEGWTPSTDFYGLMMVLQDFFDSNIRFDPNLIKKNANYCCSACFYLPTAMADKAKRVAEKVVKKVGKDVAEKVETQSVEAERLQSNGLVCSILHITIDDDVLGYPLIWNQHDLMLVPECLSHTAYEAALTIAQTHDNKKAMRTALGQLYQFWLPLYGSETHFEKALPYFEAMMLTLTNTLQQPAKWQTQFQEEMVFQILTKLLITLHGYIFAQPNNEPLLLTYGAFVQLYRHCSVRYTSMRATMLQQINFLETAPLFSRVREPGPNLPALLFMMHLVGPDHPELTYSALKKKVLAVHLQRQVQHSTVATLATEMIKREKATRITLVEIFDIFREDNQLLIMVLELTYMFNDPALDIILDKIQGVLPLTNVKDLQRRIQQCKAVCDYTVYNNALHLDIPDVKGWRQCFKNALALVYKNKF